MIRNTDTHSQGLRQAQDAAPPGHADYTGFVRYAGWGDFAAAATSPGGLPPCWSLPAQWPSWSCEERGGRDGRISNVAGIPDPTPEQMEAAILAAKAELDSVGGRIRCSVTGLPVGLGSPDFRMQRGGESSPNTSSPSLRSRRWASAWARALPPAGQPGQRPLLPGRRHGQTRTNHSGGINGGITNGMPVEFEVTLRPTPSIARRQQTVDLSAGREAELEITGRHDPLHRPPRPARH